MTNIFFALMALGVMCIDIILNRGIIDEIDDEAEEQKKEIEKLFNQINLPKAVEYIKASKDKIDFWIEKLQKKIKKGCASRRARPFYYTVVFLAFCVIVSSLIEAWNNSSSTDLKVYSWLGKLGSVIWVGILLFYIIRISMVLKFNRDIEIERKRIRKKVAETATRARIIVGDPTSPLDQSDQEEA